MTGIVDDEDRHIRERTVESNLALWNALLTVDGLLIAAFTSTLASQTGWRRWAFGIVIVSSLISAGLLIANFQAVRNLYELLGRLSNQEVAELPETTKRLQIQQAARKRLRVRHCETTVKLLLALQGVVILFLVGVAVWWGQ